MPKKKAKPKQVGKTILELAKQFDRPHQSMRSFCNELEPVGNVGKAKTFDPLEVKKLLESKIERRGKTAAQKDLESRKLELQCKKLENELSIQMREFLPAGEVRQNAATLITAVRTHLLSMPAKVASLVVGHPEHKVQKILKDHHLKCLEKLQETKFE